MTDTWVLVASALLVFAGVAGGFLLPLDVAVAGLDLRERVPGAAGVMEVADHMGQRALVLPVLFAVVGLVARRRHSWWPLLVTAVGTLVLNVIIGALKIVTDRPSPRTGGPELGQYGDLFPSGHAANVVFVYGLVAWMLVRDTRHGRRWARWLVGAVVAATAAMALISIYRDTHWLTDLIVGALIGAVVLHWTTLADRLQDPPDTGRHAIADRSGRSGLQAQGQ